MLASTVATCVALVTSIAVASPAAEASSGPCPDVNGVTVVVDFGTLGGGVQVGCAPGDPDSGYAALSGAGFSAEGTLRSPGFLCRIDAKPSASADPCVVPSPPWAYWSYWIADRGGSWCYSDTGMFGRNPPRGTVEGWVFVSGSGSSSVHAPRSSTFSRLAGAGTTGADCEKVTTATTVPATTTPKPPTPEPPTTPPTDTSSPSRPSDPGSRATGPAAPTGTPSSPMTPSQPGSTGGSSGAVGSAGAPGTTAVPGSPTTATSGDAATPAAGEPAAASEVADEAKGDSDGESDRDDAEELASSVTLADSGRSGPGSALGTGVGVGMIAALGAAAVVVNRRRLRPPDGI